MFLPGFWNGPTATNLNKLTFGDTTTVDSDFRSQGGVCRLTDTKAVMVYTDGSSTNGTAVVLSLSGTTVSAGTPTVYRASPDYHGSPYIARLDDTHVIVTYLSSTSPTFDTHVVCLEISGTSINTVGTASTIIDGVYSNGAPVISFDDTYFAVLYRNISGGATTSGEPTAKLFSRSGTTLTSEDTIALDTTDSADGDIRCGAFSSTLGVAVYRFGATTYARQISRSGTTLSVNAAHTLLTTSANAYAEGIAVLDSTRAFIAFQWTDPGDSQTKCSGLAFETNGSTFTNGTVTEIWDQGNYSIGQPRVESYSPTKAVVSILPHGTGNGPYEAPTAGAINVDISGLIVTPNPDAPVINQPLLTSSAFHGVAALTDTHGIFIGSFTTSPFVYARCLYFDEGITFAPSMDVDLTTDNITGNANEGIRVVVPSGYLWADGTKVKVTFQAANSTGNTDGFSIVSAYIGHQAVSGDAYDFDGGQVELTFNDGSSGFTIAVDESIVSDEIDFTLDSTKNLVISFGVANDTNNDSYGSLTFQASWAHYYKAAATGESGTTDVTGYTEDSILAAAVTKIEVN